MLQAPEGSCREKRCRSKRMCAWRSREQCTGDRPTAKWVLPRDSAMRVCAKLCQSTTRGQPCQAAPKRHSGSAGRAGGTCQQTAVQFRV